MGSIPGRINIEMYFKIKLVSKYKPIVCTIKNYNLNSREKFEHRPGF